MRSLAVLLIFSQFIYCSAGSVSTNYIYFCDKLTQSKTVQIPGNLMKTNQPQEFSTTIRKPKCSLTSLNATLSNVSDPTFLFYETGDMLRPDIDFLLREEYCVSKYENDVIEIQYCDVNCDVTHICIYKCCPPHQIVNYISILEEGNNSFCITPEEDRKWTPTFYDDPKGCGVKTVDHVPYHFLSLPSSHGEIGIQAFPYKDFFHQNIRHSGARFRLMKDGHLSAQTLSGTDQWEIIRPKGFCIDGMGEKDENSNGLSYSEMLHQQVFFDLDSIMEYDEFNETTKNNLTDYGLEEYPAGGNFQDYFYITLLLIGATFLFATTILYLLIWEKHNIHGWTIFAYVASMLFMFVFLATSRLLSIWKDSGFGGTTTCKNIAIFVHFMYLTCMCYLTTVNADLWLTFRNVKPINGKRGNLRRFMYYSIFAIGVPAFIVFFAVILDSIYMNGIGNGSECVPPFILPVYGEERCYIQEAAYWPWLYIPIAILLGCNLVTFSSTLFTLIMYRKSTRHVGTNAHQKESVILFAKLFVIAGVSWVAELISNLVRDVDWRVWIVFDSYNLLQAVLIFGIFALKRENIIFLYQKHKWTRWCLRPILRCCYSNSFDPERTEMTGISVDRTSRFFFRKTSTASTAAVLTRRASSDSENEKRVSLGNEDNYA